MTKYTVIADSITGIRGKHYFKGDIVSEDFFHHGSAKKLEAKGFLEKEKPKGSQKTNAKSED